MLNFNYLIFSSKDLGKKFKDNIDREKFAEVLSKNYELKLKNKDLETKTLNLISEISEVNNNFL